MNKMVYRVATNSLTALSVGLIQLSLEIGGKLLYQDIICSKQTKTNKKKRRK